MLVFLSFKFLICQAGWQQEVTQHAQEDERETQREKKISNGRWVGIAKDIVYSVYNAKHQQAANNQVWGKEDWTDTDQTR